MSKKYIIVRIILTVLLSFCIAGYILFSAADSILSLPKVYTDIIQDEKLADKAYDAIESDFEKQYNTTAIPAEVYMEAIDPQWLEKEMCKRAEIYIDYIDGKEADYLTDYSTLEKSITDFFNEYAESINYKPDDAFDKKLDETIVNAKSTIENRMDAFYMNTLKSNGYLDKIRKYTPFISMFNWILFGASMFLFVVFMFIERTRNWRRLYWSGTGMFCGSMLTAVPCIYLLCTNVINGFAVKDPIVYTAITDLLDASIWRILIKAAFFGVLGIVTILLNVIFCNKKQPVISDKQTDEK